MENEVEFNEEDIYEKGFEYRVRIPELNCAFKMKFILSISTKTLINYFNAL